MPAVSFLASGLLTSFFSGHIIRGRRVEAAHIQRRVAPRNTMMNPAAAGGDGGDAGAWTATVTHQESYGDEEEITTHQPSFAISLED